MGEVRIESLGLADITESLLSGMKKVFDAAYHASHMYRDFREDVGAHSTVFRLFLAKDGSEIIGIAVVETKRHAGIEYYGYPSVHLKRFTVLPEYRGNGIGKMLIDAVKAYAFTEENLSVIFGESNEAGALSFYGREGALYSTDAIGSYSRRNAPDDNLRFFTEFISNPFFRRYRYPEGGGIPFVFCATEKQRSEFEGRGYVLKEILLASHKK
jgi:GNAT superfamily N-acetyltransferase